MEELIAWNVFTITGKVEDYIRFKKIGKENSGCKDNLQGIEENKVNELPAEKR